MAYQLIAVDMDGTLLNSKKEITPRTAAAVTQALARGYHVVMATGRCYRQIAPYMRRFPAMRYAITSSGAAVADCVENRIISSQNIAADTAAGLLNYYSGHKLVLINRSATPYDAQADLIIHEKIGKVFAQV